MLFSFLAFFKKRNFILKSCPNAQCITRPLYVWLANKPRFFKKQVKATLTPLNEVETKLGITWIDAIQSDPLLPDRFTSILQEHEEDLLSISNEEYDERLKDLYQNCIIRWLNNEIGWVLTLRPGKTLKKGFFCCYTGIIKKIEPQHYSSYHSREYCFSLLKEEKEEIVIDAKTHGNMARFLSFFLEEDSLDNFTIDSSIRNVIAVANLKFQFAIVNGMKVPCVFAPEDITAPINQELLLGLNYSLMYLYKMQQTKKAFKFLNKNTLTVIDSELYQPKNIRIQLEGLDYSFQISRLRIMIGKYLPDIEQKTVGFNEETHEYYEITLSNADLYEALMQNPTSLILTIKPTVKLITQDNII